MNQTRRGFLGLLAHVPLVGAWLAKRKEMPTLRGKALLAQRWNERNEIPQDNPVGKDFGFRQIRWIPVTERLPEIGEGKICSRTVLVVTADEVIALKLWAKSEHHPQGWRDQYFAGPYANVTHWAELPTPPEVHE